MKCILNRDIPIVVSEYLKNENVEIIYTNKNGAVSENVGYHPDIQCAVINNTIITSPFHYNYYKDFTKNIIMEEQELKSPYPYDVLFNCFVLGDTIYGNSKYLSENIKSDKFVNVNQGYTNCSSLKVTDKAVITSDKGMEKAFLKNGVDVLFIDNTKIKLKGCEYGFIGGAGCNYKNKLIFFGNIEEYPDFPKIQAFLNKYNVTYKSFDFQLEDFGSALFFE